MVNTSILFPKAADKFIRKIGNLGFVFFLGGRLFLRRLAVGRSTACKAALLDLVVLGRRDARDLVVGRDVAQFVLVELLGDAVAVAIAPRRTARAAEKAIGIGDAELGNT